MRIQMRLLPQHRLRGTIGLLLAVFLIFSAGSTVVFAAPSVSAEAGSSSGSAGDIVTVPVSIDPHGHDLWAYTMELAYDPSALEPAGEDAVSDGTSAYDFEADTSVSGTIGVSSLMLDFVSEKQAVFSVSFRIKESAPVGDTSVSITSGTYTSDTDPMPIGQKKAGTVSVIPPVSKVTVGAGSVTGSAGGTVSVPVTVISATYNPVASYGIQIDFDATALQVGSIVSASGDYFDSAFDNAQGWLKVGWADTAGGGHARGAGDELFTIEFTIKSGASAGDKPLTVNPVDVAHFTVTDPDAVEMVKTWTNGKVTVTPGSSGNNGSSVSGSSTSASGMDVIVNGKSESLGKATSSKVDGRTVTTVELDKAKLQERLAAEKAGAVVTIPVTVDTDVAVVGLDGELLGRLTDKQSTVVIQTRFATYTLPIERLKLADIASKLGQGTTPESITLRIEISAPTAAMTESADTAAETGGYSIVAPPVSYTITASSGGSSVEISDFDAYVERTVTLPENADPSKITTGVVFDPDGTVRHVPTEVVSRDGHYVARINSLTNSAYGVIWHPIQFADVAGHWSQDAVNDMGSRMVVEGTEDGQYLPNRNITRAEFAAILVRGLGLKPTGGSASFNDVKQADWYFDAVETAYAYKLFTGFEDGSFRPNDTLTREQAMTLVARAMGITGLQAKLGAADEAKLDSYADAGSVAGWAREGVADCLQSTVVNGRSSDELAPRASMTRAEVAAIVERLLQKSGLI